MDCNRNERSSLDEQPHRLRTPLQSLPTLKNLRSARETV
ncbi:BQ5605_C010g06129 [Microbotryum silenes-dioicae]|uniref:BQ5605_C010g06129 protein n=1 Tax=Microbotryum silenes-dioicae TaxID=796604 RepID=A0A2X0LUS0_9BASI|nr:BQ5605_C010g06129 [Microbotryum silenes-dioicae]